MDTEKMKKLMVRWSVLTAGVIALFWGAWYLITGSIPVVTEIRMASNWTIHLPFGISRLSDVAVGPIWSTLLIWIFCKRNEKKEEKEDLVFGLIVGLVFGLAYGLAYGLVYAVSKIFSLKFWKSFGNYWKLFVNYMMAHE